MILDTNQTGAHENDFSAHGYCGVRMGWSAYLPTAPMQSLAEPASVLAERQPLWSCVMTFARNPAVLGVLPPSAAPVGHRALLL